MNNEFSADEKELFNKLFGSYGYTQDFNNYYKIFFDEAIKSKARQLFDLQELCRLNVKIRKNNIDQYYKASMELAFLFILKKKFDSSEFKLNEEDFKLGTSFFYYTFTRRI
jgi:hypothetical protein